jgi:Ion channel
MKIGLEGRLHSMQLLYGESLLTFLTVLLALLMFVISPLQPDGIIFQVIAALTGVAIICGAMALSNSRLAFAILLAAFVLNVVVLILRDLHDPSIFHLYLVASAWLMLAVTLSTIVARVVFGPGRVNYHRIIGAIFLYMLIALTFSAVFIIIGLLVPNAFSGITFGDTPALAGQLFYFNFVTLTSTGYGDILPIHPIARSLCNVESIIGQFYPATLLARLVSLEIEGRRRQ